MTQNDADDILRAVKRYAYWAQLEQLARDKEGTDNQIMTCTHEMYNALDCVKNLVNANVEEE